VDVCDFGILCGCVRLWYSVWMCAVLVICLTMIDFHRLSLLSRVSQVFLASTLLTKRYIAHDKCRRLCATCNLPLFSTQQMVCPAGLRNMGNWKKQLGGRVHKHISRQGRQLERGRATCTVGVHMDQFVLLTCQKEPEKYPVCLSCVIAQVQMFVKYVFILFF
jgi:hypothetical protein